MIFLGVYYLVKHIKNRPRKPRHIRTRIYCTDEQTAVQLKAVFDTGIIEIL